MSVINFFYKIILFLFKLSVLIVKCEENQFRTYTGEEVDIKEIPYTVSTSIGCTGALIRPQWVLSAAHCFVHSDLRSMSIGLGAADWSKCNYNLWLQKVYVHPQYAESSNFITRALYDIAVIKLAKPAVLSEYVQLLELDHSTWPAGENMRECTLAGYGRTVNEYYNTIVHMSRFYFTLGCNCVRSKNLLCTSTANDGDDSPCFGDSGSVVVCDNKGVAITSHLVSSGYCNLNGTDQYCGSKDGFTLFTYILGHLPWLYHIIENEPNTFLSSKSSGLTMKDIQYYGIITVSVQLFALLITFS